MSCAHASAPSRRVWGHVPPGNLDSVITSGAFSSHLVGINTSSWQGHWITI